MQPTPPGSGGPAVPPPLPPGVSAGPATPPVPAATPASTEEIDLAAAARAGMADPNWIPTVAMVGVATFVPLLGQLVHLGWARRLAAQLRAGEPVPLPAVDLVEDVQAGVAPFAAVLNLAVPAGVIATLTVVPGAIMSSVTEGGALAVVGALLSGLGFVLLMLLNLVAIVTLPELLRRGFRGEMTPLLSPMESIQAIRARPSAYATVALGVFLAQMLGGLGTLVCYLGVVITAPLGLAMAAHVVDQWDRLVGPRPPA